MEILVNGRPRAVPARAVTFEHLVSIAAFEGAEGAKVMWRRYAKGSEESELLPGKTLKPEEGMVVTVTRDAGAAAQVVPVGRG